MPVFERKKLNKDTNCSRSVSLHSSLQGLAVSATELSSRNVDRMNISGKVGPEDLGEMA